MKEAREEPQSVFRSIGILLIISNSLRNASGDALKRVAILPTKFPTCALYDRGKPSSINLLFLELTIHVGWSSSLFLFISLLCSSGDGGYILDHHVPLHITRLLPCLLPNSLHYKYKQVHSIIHERSELI